MKKNVPTSALVVGMSLGLGLVTDVLAQDSLALEEIIVTARRREESLQDVPISISVLNQQELTNRNIVTAGDLGAYVPSLSTNSRFGAETTSFAIRGFTQEQQTAPSVAVYFADVTAPRAQGGTSGGNGAGVGAFFDLQNVQILRGPQGTLFGRNTTGGAVLLVPQKPTGEFEGYLEAAGGDYDMRRVQGVVNTPFSESVRFRIGADTQQREGYLTNKSGIGPKDFADVDYWAVRTSLVIDITPELENYTIASFSDSDTNGFYPRIAVCNPANPLTGLLACGQLARQSARGDDLYDIENGNPRASQSIKQRQLINTTTWLLSDTLTVKNIASYAEFEQAQTSNIFGDNFSLAPGVPLTYVGLYTTPSTINIQQWTATEELQFQGTGIESFTWQAGLYFEKSGPLDGFQGTRSPILKSCSNVDTVTCPAGPGFVQESLTEYEFRNLGAYVQGTYSFTEQLSLTAGVRYTSDRTEGTGRVRSLALSSSPIPLCSRNFAPGLTPAACSVTFVQKSEEPTWLIDLEYSPVDAVMLYGKYARGYRQGGVNTSNLAFELWDPEQVDSYEIGSKLSFSQSLNGFLNIAAFYNDFTDQQLAANAVPAPGSPTSPSQVVVNAGKSRIQGVEVDASITPFDALKLDLSYAYLDTKLESFTAPPFDRTRFATLNPTAVVGGDLSLSPNHRVTFSALFSLPLPESIGKISLGADYTYTDEQVASSDSIIGQLPSTKLVNANVRWEGIAGSPVDVSLFGTNLTDEQYSTYVGGSWRSAGFDSYIMAPPRMYGARVRYSFGN